jgi:hypothetical protein
MKKKNGKALSAWCSPDLIILPTLDALADIWVIF